MPIVNRSQWLQDIQDNIETGLEQLINSSPGINDVEKTFNAINLAPNKFDIVKFDSAEIDKTLTETTPWILYNAEHYNLSAGTNIVISSAIVSDSDGLHLTSKSGTSLITEKILLKSKKNQNNIEILKVERIRVIARAGTSPSFTYTVNSDEVLTTTVVFKTLERKIINNDFNPSDLATNVGPKTVGYDAIGAISGQFELSTGEAAKLQRAMMLLPFVGDKVRMQEIKDEMENPTPIL